GLFARARAHYKKHGYPALLFIDEADALLGKRGARLNMGTETTVVPQFLSEMDGLHEPGCIVMLATNRSDSLDPAVVRERRVDVKIRVNRPNKSSSEEIFKISMRGLPLDGMDEQTAQNKAVEALFNPEWVLYEVHPKGKRPEKFTLGHMVSGAMISTMA